MSRVAHDRAIAIAREALRAALAVLETIDAAPADVETDPWVAVDEHLRVTRRAAAKLCRAGAIDGAVIVARRWRARRSTLDTWIASQRPRPTTGREAEDGPADGSRTLAALGLALVPEASSRRRPRAA